MLNTLLTLTLNLSRYVILEETKEVIMTKKFTLVGKEFYEKFYPSLGWFILDYYPDRDKYWVTPRATDSLITEAYISGELFRAKIREGQIKIREPKQ